MENFDRAIDLDPGYAQAWYCKGEALRLQGMYDEAVAILDRAIEIEPEVKEAWLSRGLTLTALGRDREAYEAFEKAGEGAG
jgi:tetratricopeptide (TPR) repeat protein